MMMMICKCLYTKEVEEEEEEEEEGLISPICKLLLLLLLAVELKLVGRRSIKIYRRMVEANPHILEFQQQI
jgi:hypothetical protein